MATESPSEDQAKPSAATIGTPEARTRAPPPGRQAST